MLDSPFNISLSANSINMPLSLYLKSVNKSLMSNKYVQGPLGGAKSTDKMLNKIEVKVRTLASYDLLGGLSLKILAYKRQGWWRHKIVYKYF